MKKYRQQIYTVFSKELVDVGDVIFKSKKEAKEWLIGATYHSNPLVMKEVQKKYKIIPAVITYEV